MPKERDFYYDNLKGLLIFLVVLCHFLGGIVSKSDVFTRTLIVFIYYFHMPLFIFISGYFSKNPDKARSSAFRTLLLVFVIAQVFWIIFKFIANGSVYYLQHFLDPGYAIWYVVALFFWRLLLKDLIKIPHILIISFLISPLIMILSQAEMTLAINKTVGFLFFFLLGYYTNGEIMNKIRAIPVLPAAAGLIAIFIGTFLLIKFDILSYGGMKALLLHTKTLGSFDSIWFGILAYYGALVMSVITGVLVMAVMPQKKNILAYIGGDTMPLYLSHTYFLIIADLVFAAVALSYGVQYIIVLGATLLLTVIFSTPIYRKIFHAVYDFCINVIYPPELTKEKSNE